MPAKLVAIGDSLTQGFKNGAITDTHLSFPNLIAQAIGDDDFGKFQPDFSGEDGLPLNIERLLRFLQETLGDHPNLLQTLRSLPGIRANLDVVEDYWERGPGTKATHTGPLHRNLAVWGFLLLDALHCTERTARQWLEENPPLDNLFKQIPQESQRRTIRRTLNPSFDGAFSALNQVRLAAKIKEENGGLENLILWLGANNALSTLRDMKIVWSGQSQAPNLWRPELFAEEWRQLADEVDAIGARRVFVCTVPHITIPPLTRGVTVNGDALIDGYYEFYTFFWVWDSAFKRDPRSFPRLTREEARLIDRTIDQYNDTIRADAAARGWRVAPIDEMLDSLAFRRSKGKPRYAFPPKLVDAVAQNPDAKGRVSNGKLSLDTRFLRLDQNNTEPQERYKGGIFSLDGLHPSTIGYGLVAHEILKVMRSAWQDERPDWQAFEIDWPHVVQADTLLTKPPGNLGHLQDTLSMLYNFTPLREAISLL